MNLYRCTWYGWKNEFTKALIIINGLSLCNILDKSLILLFGNCHQHWQHSLQFFHGSARFNARFDATFFQQIHSHRILITVGSNFYHHCEKSKHRCKCEWTTDGTINQSINLVFSYLHRFPKPNELPWMSRRIRPWQPWQLRVHP